MKSQAKAAGRSPGWGPWLAAGLWTAIVGGTASTPALAGEPRRIEVTQPHMWTDFRIVLYADDEAAARRACDAAFARVAKLDQSFSDYNPDSEMMRLCARAGTGPVQVSADLLDILERARTISDRSDGAFDVTVGPVVRLWRRSRRDRQMPKPEVLAAALALVDYRNVRIDRKAGTVELTKPGIRLDLGGIAKGYASEAALKVLRQNGFGMAMVAAAGDIAVGDPPPGREGWSIAVAGPNPDEPDARPERTVLLKNRMISTSGDASQFVEIDGVRYSHIVDAKTGRGIVRRGSVTVIAPDGGTADGLDTAAFALGPEKGLKMVDAVEGAAGVFLLVTPEGLRTFESKRMSQYPPAREPSSRPDQAGTP